MAMPIQFKSTVEKQADAILANAKRKVDWARLDISSMPPDVAALATGYLEAEQVLRQMKDQLAATLNDKIDLPSGKRLILGATREASPDAMASLLYAFVDGSTRTGLRTVTFDQFIKA
jgi:hypothetical protein